VGIEMVGKGTIAMDIIIILLPPPHLLQKDGAVAEMSIEGNGIEAVTEKGAVGDVEMKEEIETFFGN
jgi:hypothetical protein